MRAAGRIVHSGCDFNDFLALVAKEPTLTIAFRMQNDSVAAHFVFDHSHGLFQIGRLKHLDVQLDFHHPKYLQLNTLLDLRVGKNDDALDGTLHQLAEVRPYRRAGKNDRLIAHIRQLIELGI